MPEITRRLAETAAQKKTATAVQEEPAGKDHGTSRDVPSSWETLQKRKVTSRETITIEGKKIKLADIERVIWKGHVPRLTCKPEQNA